MSICFTKQSTLHCAVIMDGNGRWATERGHSRVRGHRAGADAVRRTIEAALELPISTLTLYAFSADNWKRPQSEVRALMMLFSRYLREEAVRCLQNDIRLCVIGRRDRLDTEIVAAIEDAERLTGSCSRLLLRIAIDYSSRDAIVAAAATAPETRQQLSAALNAVVHSPDTPEVDLLIRTGREKRLSDFLLWECAYAELFFLDCMWPEFGAAELRECVESFLGRERRFGAVPVADAPLAEVAHV
jgi:undecaprenyl diphosphate synthase